MKAKRCYEIKVSKTQEIFEMNKKNNGDSQKNKPIKGQIHYCPHPSSLQPFNFIVYITHHYRCWRKRLKSQTPSLKIPGSVHLRFKRRNPIQHSRLSNRILSFDCFRSFDLERSYAFYTELGKWGSWIGRRIHQNEGTYEHTQVILMFSQKRREYLNFINEWF